jgi:hypothetical protein
LEIVGGISLVIVTVLLDEGQTPLEIVQTNLLIPLLNPVAVVVEAVVLETEPVPDKTVHKAVPVIGVFAFKVTLDAHKVCETPALETVGGISLVTVTVLLDEGQTPLEIVQTNLLIPLLNPVTVVEALAGVVTEPVPVMTDHKPVPAVGVLAAKVTEDVQSVCGVPAFEIPGELSTFMTIEALVKVLAHNPVTITLLLK